VSSWQEVWNIRTMYC